MIGVLPQILVNGILFGTMYGIAAVGLSLISAPCG
jgi:branched-subunit amino acid ABC-type transport system permease component